MHHLVTVIILYFVANRLFNLLNFLGKFLTIRFLISIKRVSHAFKNFNYVWDLCG